MLLDNLLLENNFRSLVMVSGGPDSMVLLHLLYRAKLPMVVATINYQTRGKESDLDVALVEKFCRNHKIPCRTLIAEPHESGNKQDYYRKVRINFIKKLSLELRISDVYFGHTLDDHIETYLMQKKRKTEAFYFGLQVRKRFEKLNFHRPLLDYYKKEILDYARRYNVPYRIDASNNEPVYERNKIRLELDDEAREYHRRELMDTNRKLRAISCAPSLTPTAIGFGDERQLIAVLFRHTGYYISKALAKEIMRASKKDKSCISVKVKDYILQFSYRDAYLLPPNYQLTYKVTLNYGDEDVIVGDYHFSFKLLSDKFTYFNKSDLPLQIRAANSDDWVMVNGFQKKVLKFYRDNKIVHYLRKTLPVVVTKNNKVILIPNLYYEKSKKKLRLFQFP